VNRVNKKIKKAYDALDLDIYYKELDERIKIHWNREGFLKVEAPIDRVLGPVSDAVNRNPAKG
jgi:hypothetical protein